MIIRLAVVCSALCSVWVAATLRAAETETLELQLPIASQSILGGELGQAYAEFNDVKESKYHVGIDIPATKETAVLAAASGIAKTIPMGTMEFPNSGANVDNHCMGNVVIIDHSNGMNLSGPFTLYAHLETISISDGESVEQGIQIGTVGQTGYTMNARKTDCRGDDKARIPGPHLHFELKTRPVLHNPMNGSVVSPEDNAKSPCNAAKCDWGYNKKHPKNVGYLDPVRYLSSSITEIPSTVVQVLPWGDGARLRIGPGGKNSVYRGFNVAHSGDRFLAVAKAESPVTEGCASWYKVRKTSAECSTKSTNCFLDTSPGHTSPLQAQMPDGWICRLFVENQKPKDAEPTSKPPRTWVLDIGTDQSPLLPALPFVEKDKEIDVFKGRWRLRKDHPVYRREGDMQSSTGHLKAGSVVDALSIATHTLSYGVCEVKARRQEDFWDFEAAGKADYSVTVEQGDWIAFVSYFGEGECRIWFKGRTYISMCPGNGGLIDQDECAGDLKQEYWAEIIMKDGTRQWLHSPDAEGMSKHDSTVE